MFLTVAPWLSSPTAALGVAAAGAGAPSIERTVTATTMLDLPRIGAPAAPEATTPPSVVATSVSPVAVYQEPDQTGEAQTLDPADQISGQLVFLVRQELAGWLQVYLPVRPNGSTGWVRADGVAMSQHRYRIQLSLSQRRLLVFKADKLIMDEPIGVGAEDTPTPGGVYYLKELLRPPDPAGFYGPYAYGLSGFSNTLFDYRGGEGVIGIHGTDDSASVGQDVSNGCIRLSNEAIVRLAEEIGLPLGTPVQIDA